MVGLKLCPTHVKRILLQMTTYILKILFFLKRFISFYVYLCVCVCAAHIHRCPQKLEGGTGSPESEIQAVVNHLLSMSEMKPGYSVIAALLT